MFPRAQIARVFSALGLIALLLGAAAARPASAAEQLCFAETGYCIEGRFAAYWQQNGGLPVFGFPIGPAQQEVNRETGQSYLTQWFERNRFELHPENRAPYDVLLGRLGDDLLRRQGIDWQAQPREAGPQAGCLWFAQTGHNVCDQAGGLGFKSYWQSHGLRDERLDSYGRSLALFGLPLTEARVELNAADGQPYLTQWFERGRFEWHPEQTDAYKVLLGLLGNETRAGAATRVAEHVLGRPAGSARGLYWFEMRDGLTALFGLDVAGGRQVALSGQPDTSVAPATSGDYIAWVERTPDGQSQFVILNTIFSRLDLPRIILESRGSNTTSLLASIALDGRTLYYADLTQGHTGLFARNVDTGEEQLIDAKGSFPVAADGVLLWSTNADNGKTGAGMRVSWTLHMRKLDGGEERVVTTVPDAVPGGIADYAVTGDNIVWSYSSPGVDNRVFRYQISNGAWGPLSADAADSPSISGATVAWATNPYFDRDPGVSWAVQTYDLRTGAIKTVAQGLNPEGFRYVALAGGRAAYTAKGQQDAAPTLYLAAR
jgi:hypothetical protein